MSVLNNKITSFLLPVFYQLYPLIYPEQLSLFLSILPYAHEKAHSTSKDYQLMAILSLYTICTQAVDTKGQDIVEYPLHNIHDILQQSK